MGCNCGKNKPPLSKSSAPPPGKNVGTTQQFSLETPDRRVTTYGSRLEAEAARVRSGGVGQITAR